MYERLKRKTEKIRGSRFLILYFRITLGAIFLASALGKLVDIERYSVNAVYSFGILPLELARPFGLAMPFVELIISLALLAGIMMRLAAFGATMLSASFLGAKAVVLAQGDDIACGCFGAIIDTLASVTIIMDAVMILMGLAIAFALPEARHFRSVGAFLSQKMRDRLRWVW